MAINLSMIDMKNTPPYLKVIIAAVPSILLIILFIVLIYTPKNKELKRLDASIVKLDNEIKNSEVKIRKLDTLKIENARLKRRLAELQEQLPEEKEVSNLLKQISDLGLKSGLDILLWKPEPRKPEPSGLYVEIPVKVEVIGGYHNLGVFFSHISRITRIVNISDIKISSPEAKKGIHLIKAGFTARTFSAMTESEREDITKK